MCRKHILSPVSFKQNSVSFHPWLGTRASFMDRWPEQYRGPHTHRALTFIVLKPCLSVVLEISSIFEWEARLHWALSWPAYGVAEPVWQPLSGNSKHIIHHPSRLLSSPSEHRHHTCFVKPEPHPLPPLFICLLISSHFPGEEERPFLWAVGATSRFPSRPCFISYFLLLALQFSSPGSFC